MGKRRVVCQVTKEEGLSGTFYRVRHNNRNLYYKDEETYLKSIRDKKLKDEIDEFVAIEILNYDSGNYVPPFFKKRVNQLNKLYPLEVILSTFKSNLENLQYWMNQDSKFKDENGRINYMMAIVTNNINNEYEKWKVKQRQDKVDNKIKLDAENINLAVDVSNQDRKTKKKKDSISDFI